MVPMNLTFQASPRRARSFAKRGRRSFRPKFPNPQTAAIRAELVGSDSCTALGITVTAAAPVLALCRKLIAAGHDPGFRLDVFRGETLCLIVRSIGEAAGLEISHHGVGFLARYEGGTAPLTRQIRRVDPMGAAGKASKCRGM
jgi:hypothetical protein